MKLRDDRHRECDENRDRSIILSDTQWSRRTPRRYLEDRNGIESLASPPAAAALQPRLRSE